MASSLSFLRPWKAQESKPEVQSPSNTPSSNARPRSMFASPQSQPSSPGMDAQPNIVSLAGNLAFPKINGAHRRGESKGSATFAPQFIGSLNKTKEEDSSSVSGLEGENDFSGKRYVWVKDPAQAFVKGWVEQELEGDQLLVRCDDGSQRQVDSHSVDKVNPGKFDKVDDMAELTHLNEASVVNNLHMRYQSDLIYTYSGLFLVAVNPYCSLPIYNNEYINMFRGRSRDETKPHIFAIADEAYQKLMDEGQNQSILVTGESGAGKTENTKKVIQYLAAIASNEIASRPTSRQSSKSSKPSSNLSQQILRANPILEAFGNAQTMRNNNSSRFGKFIRIEFTDQGQIAGAFIDWYLLEKSRVVKLNQGERNYHIFYQLLKGAPRRLKQDLQLHEVGIDHYAYLRDGNDNIGGVSDADEWRSLMDSFGIMGFSEAEQFAVLRTVAAILHLGNISVVKESLRSDQAALAQDARIHIESACRLLGIPADQFIRSLLHPKVRAGREIVEKVQTPEQAKNALDALAKNIYERSFGDLVSRINRQLDRGGMESGDHSFIGVLDIAGFEIFQDNGFEQLCINYTNEKLQQFFNHHMFVLEQEEYAREKIQWNFIDFGKDLQPTIDLIELSNPIGIFSCLDEDSVMPKATDASFTDKLHHLWDHKTPKYRSSRLAQGFVLTHYAAEVEYSTEGWLQKNKDPQNENLTALLAASSDQHVADLFSDCGEVDDSMPSKSRVKRGLFRTVAQKHKEQLSNLMAQLHATQPHFVRCILPNHKKRPKQFGNPLVLDQLRCNGVLEGIRIARTGFPNRLPFAEFRSRYEVLCKDFPRGIIDGQKTVQLIVSKLKLDTAVFRVGLTKIFFRAGVLAELEEKRDLLIQLIMTRFQANARGFTRRKAAYKLLYRAEAVNVIEESFRAYLKLQQNPWWSLFNEMRPLLGQTRTDQEVKQRDGKIKELELKMQEEALNRQKVEDEKKRVETEIQRVHKTLESERALAFDKEEIFKRLQQRESELSEKLAEALQDQEDLEDQLDGIVDAKKKVEEQAVQWRAELENAGNLVAQLTKEKEQLSSKHDSLQEQLQDNERSWQANQGKHNDLSREIKMLTSQLALKDRKLQELEHNQATVDRDLDKKLADTSNELQASKRQIRELLEENRQTRQQMSDLSASSADFDNMIRRKESELNMVKNDLRKLQADREAFEGERRTLSTKHEQIQGQLRQLRTESDTFRAQKLEAERELHETRKLLDAHISEDEAKKQLEDHVQHLTSQLLETQEELHREQQTRDNSDALSNQKYDELRRRYDNLNENKILIEKELYSTQDSLRLASDSKSSTDEERRAMQAELRKLRQRFLDVEKNRLETEAAIEQNAVRQANEKNQVLHKEVTSLVRQLDESEHERKKLVTEAQRLSKAIADTDAYKITKDQKKDHLERELVTLKGRLNASENDNRALLNKIQQKNLDLSRSTSKAGDSHRARIAVLAAEKQRAEEENRSLSQQLTDAKLLLTSAEKQKEKLALDLEDLNHEVAREHKTSRTAEKSSSTSNAQLAEANRSLEIEKQLRSQAQANGRKLQSTLDQANQELVDCRKQLLLLQKVFDPTIQVPQKWEDSSHLVAKNVNLAQQLQQTEQGRRVALDRAARAEGKMSSARQEFEDELWHSEQKHTSSKRAIFEEMNQNIPRGQRSPRKLPQPGGENRPPLSTAQTTTPIHRRHHSNATESTIHSSAMSDKTVDTVTYQKKMDFAAELEQTQNQLQMAQIQNKFLQSQLDRVGSSREIWADDSPSARRVQKLEKENNRLHDMLDDSAKKMSSLEKALQSGHLSLKDVRAQSHEELFNLLNSQEKSRKSLQKTHSSVVDELAAAKEAFEMLKRSRETSERDVQILNSQLAESQAEKDANSSSHAQLLEEFAELQCQLGAESSALSDARASMNLYRARADEYFSKLEQAEIAVLKSSRNEAFMKQKTIEAATSNEEWSDEKCRLDGLVEDLSKETQMLGEKVEDYATDLASEQQRSKRLQHELEDYRSQRAVDIEEREMANEATRRKYQAELTGLATDLQLERETLLGVRQQNSRLCEEIEDLRAKWDDEVLNSSTWAKEKQRLEAVLEDVSSSRDEAVSAHNDAQGRLVTLLGQIRSLRSEVEELTEGRETLWKEKRTLEQRLKEAGEKLDELAGGDDAAAAFDDPNTPGEHGAPKSRSPVKDRALLEKQILDLRATLASKEDITSAAIGKMRRAEVLAAETTRDVSLEREANVRLHTEKAALERASKELRARIVDLETRGSQTESRDVRFLHGRVAELEQALEQRGTEQRSRERSARGEGRAIKDLEAQVERRVKRERALEEELGRWRAKVEALLKEVEAVELGRGEESVKVRRAEREVREEREERLRVERELEGWKGLRMEKPGGSLAGAGASSGRLRSGSGSGSLRGLGREGSLRPGSAMSGRSASIRGGGGSDSYRPARNGTLMSGSTAIGSSDAGSLHGTGAGAGVGVGLPLPRTSFEMAGRQHLRKGSGLKEVESLGGMMPEIPVRRTSVSKILI